MTIRTILVALVAFTSSLAHAADLPPLAEYFRFEVEKIAAKPLAGIKTADEWKAARPELQRKMIRMLGLDPALVQPNNGATPLEELRGELNPVITRTIERPDFFMDCLYFQSKPGLYVTANLYRPKKIDKPLPAILYVCGHSKNEKDGFIYGCKAHYQHHAAWYAANGYICLIVDTLQLGELPGLHHGTSRFGMWWWASQGYTPAGVETWNGIRGIDYLLTRKEVDKQKIGVTGRSGGGATSWWLGAIDDRISVVLPVAGITDLKNHVVDGVVEGHCDCMYHVNTERWDFDTIAALAAPKAMLVENTDKDPIFPEDGVRRIYSQVEKVYGWYGAKEKLGLVIGKGGHADTTELRHPSFAFMDRWLKDVKRPIDEPDRKIPMDDVQVIKGNRPPDDCQNVVIHESFREHHLGAIVESEGQTFFRDNDRLVPLSELRVALSKLTFAGWPTDAEAGPLNAKLAFENVRGPVRVRGFDYQSQPGINLRMWSLDLVGQTLEPKAVRIVVIDPNTWTSTWGAILGNPKATTPFGVGDGVPLWIEARSRILLGERIVLVAPRGVGPTAWPVENDKQIRRRFMLLGQTLDGMRVWDVHRSINVAQETALIPGNGLRSQNPAGLTMAASGEGSTWLLWATIMREPTSALIDLDGLPTSIKEGPAYLNISSFMNMERAERLLKSSR
jgi:dienelactone hydrolase